MEPSTGDAIDAALKDWAYWVKGGRESDGYPRRNVLHPLWMPPAPGALPTMTVARRRDDRRQRQVHQAIGRLSVKMSNTIVVHYCYRLTVAEQCDHLGCAESTLHHRLRVAKQQLFGMLKFMAITN